MDEKLNCKRGDATFNAFNDSIESNLHEFSETLKQSSRVTCIGTVIEAKSW